MSTMPDTYNEAEAWAKARIGKRVYRPDLGCTCSICRKIVAEGLLITDELQAIYATDCAMEMGYRYQDEPIVAPEISNLEHEKRPPILPATALPEAQGPAGLRQDPADTH